MCWIHKFETGFDSGIELKRTFRLINITSTCYLSQVEAKIIQLFFQGGILEKVKGELYVPFLSATFY
jgi:hypothetical protein